MSERDGSDMYGSVLADMAVARYGRVEICRVFQMRPGGRSIVMYMDGAVVLRDQEVDRGFPFGLVVRNYGVRRMVETVLEAERGVKVRFDAHKRVLFEFGVLDREQHERIVCRVYGTGRNLGFQALLGEKLGIVNRWAAYCGDFVTSILQASLCPASSETADGDGGGQGCADQTASSPAKNVSAPGET